MLCGDCHWSSRGFFGEGLESSSVAGRFTPSGGGAGFSGETPPMNTHSIYMIIMNTTYSLLSYPAQSKPPTSFDGLYYILSEYPCLPKANHSPPLCHLKVDGLSAMPKK